MFGPKRQQMPNRRKRKAPRGEHGAFALIKSSKGFWGNYIPQERNLLYWRYEPPARLDEFRADALLPVSGP
jgi:hypothetical protein